MITDAYIMAAMIPTVIFAGISSAITAGFIPVFTEEYKKEGLNSSFELANKILSILLFFLVIWTLIGFFNVNTLVEIFAPGFTDDAHKITTTLVKYTIFSSIFVICASVFAAMLQVLGNFWVPSAISITQNIIIILSICISATIWGIEAVAVGTVLGMASHVFFQYPYLYKKGYRFKLFFNPFQKVSVGFLHNAYPIIIGMLLLNINTIIDRSLASSLEMGTITALNFSQKLSNFLFAVVGLSIITIIYPKFAKLYQNGTLDKFKTLLSETVTNILVIMVPLLCILIILREPIVEVIFEYGSFDHRATEMTATGLLYYSLGIIALTIQELFSRALYSLKDTKSSMYSAGISVLINILLNYLLISYMGLGGLALATSISLIIRMVILEYLLRRKIGGWLELKSFLINIIKVCIAALLMSIVIAALVELYYSNHSKLLLLMNIGLVIILGLCVYAISLRCLKVDFTMKLKSFIK